MPFFDPNVLVLPDPSGAPQSDVESVTATTDDELSENRFGSMYRWDSA